MWAAETKSNKTRFKQGNWTYKIRRKEQEGKHFLNQNAGKENRKKRKWMWEWQNWVIVLPSSKCRYELWSSRKGLQVFLPSTCAKTARYLCTCSFSTMFNYRFKYLIWALLIEAIKAGVVWREATETLDGNIIIDSNTVQQVLWVLYSVIIRTCIHTFV